MKTVKDKTSTSIKGQKSIVTTVVLLAVSVVCFAATVHWIVRQTLLHEQLLNAFSMLLLAGVALITEKKRSLEFSFRFEKHSLVFPGIAFLLAGLSILPYCRFLILPACGFAVSSWVLVIFGRRLHKLSNVLLLVFILYSGIILFLPYLDWPLRRLAGSQASWILEKMGHVTKLGIAELENISRLVLSVDGKIFHVAAECNGYGIISSAALIALLLLYYDRKLTIGEKAFYWLAALCTGVVFNILRIIIIIKLYRFFSGAREYHLMHETVGYISLIACLLLIWYKLHWTVGKKSEGKKA